MELSEKKIIEMFRELTKRRSLYVEKSLKTFMNVAGEEKNILGVDTKVKHKGSLLLYTVHDVRPDEVVLKTPENKLFIVPEKEFSDEYELS
jgi:hypothetical protein